MTPLNTIKEAVNQGKTVYADSLIHRVIKDSKGQYMIKCSANGYCIGLHWQNGTELNASKFFII